MRKGASGHSWRQRIETRNSRSTVMSIREPKSKRFRKQVRQGLGPRVRARAGVKIRVRARPGQNVSV